MINHPRLLSIASFAAMWLAAIAGVYFYRKLHAHSAKVAGQDPNEKETKSTLTIVVPGTLTLLGLIISFTFSMAAARYDQRRLYEEGEANAIGTAYVRADLMPAPQAAATRQLLLRYLKRRIDFYQSDYGSHLLGVDRETTQLQGELWKSVQPLAAAQPTPVTALVVSGVNDVLNAQGYTQFSWWNRIPTSAWVLMIVIALAANLLLGYTSGRVQRSVWLLSALPAIVAVALFLIADIDSPRGGIIELHPRNLISLQETLQSSTQ